ncbi:MAG TPA: hypothetical protein EYQ50_22420 [Verrucomicrobiales bacterium]|nr:hypothetical protein [Verrucomicrobiales bacterium]
MIRYAEAVFNGHPDRFCDLIADRIIEEAYAYDPEAYGQVEVGVWSDVIWLSGAVVTRNPFQTDLMDLIVEVGDFVGYSPDNHIDVRKYRLNDHVCRIQKDPLEWTRNVNDQDIVIGWAGYDEKTRFLSPEQFLVHLLREGFVDSMKSGILLGEGPDGKMLVRIREEGTDWIIENILITVQQRESTPLLEICSKVVELLQELYANLQMHDSRWVRDWNEIGVLINPNGPLVNGGSDGDNGQTGRKLVVDYYGPRVPIGGGALSGKDLTHIDRASAYAARREAIRLVKGGAEECRITLVYAPNHSEPLDVRFDLVRNPGIKPDTRVFAHRELIKKTRSFKKVSRLGQGTHFYDDSLPWNDWSEI